MYTTLFLSKVSARGLVEDEDAISKGLYYGVTRTCVSFAVAYGRAVFYSIDILDHAAFKETH